MQKTVNLQSWRKLRKQGAKWRCKILRRCKFGCNWGAKISKVQNCTKNFRSKFYVNFKRNINRIDCSERKFCQYELDIRPASLNPWHYESTRHKKKSQFNIITEDRIINLRYLHGTVDTCRLKMAVNPFDKFSGGWSFLLM